jgi:hypothetical protein
MSDFSIVNGVAEIHDPELYRALYRATDGMLSEHWGAFRKLAPGQAPM